MSEFRFKRFTVRQDRCPMKVGTDGVLLGAWAGVRPDDRRMLDIGTGTGLIALMLAQRTAYSAVDAEDATVDAASRAEVFITGVDVEDISEACGNADRSPWSGRIDFVQCPVQEFRSDRPFDLIVSNPPYFVDSLTCPDRGRTLARHAVSLSYEALCEAVVRLLAPGGRFAVILPTDCAAQFLTRCRGLLSLRRRTDVRTTPHRAPKRVLMEFTAAADAPDAPPLTDTLVVGTGEHEQYTQQYRALTRDFYLKF